MVNNRDMYSLYEILVMTAQTIFLLLNPDAYLPFLPMSFFKTHSFHPTFFNSIISGGKGT